MLVEPICHPKEERTHAFLALSGAVQIDLQASHCFKKRSNRGWSKTPNTGRRNAKLTFEEHYKKS